MWETFKGYGMGRYQALKSLFGPNRPHFSFIWAHYIWIISGTIIASILIYASGKGNLSYIDALLFASGVNTQAGLNPVDVNKLNTAQQIVMYLFPMMSNPITLHGSVVILRLYWFEKRFQHVVKDARQKRTTLTKTRSKGRNEERQAEEGVNGRNIRIVPRQGGTTPPRLTNDGMVLADDPNAAKVVGSSDGMVLADDPNAAKVVGSSDGSDTTTAEAPQDPDDTCAVEEGDHEDTPEGQALGVPRAPANARISFANTVKRSDGIDDDPTNGVHHRRNTEHIKILQAQRNPDNEILRIPGPRETERGLGPRRLGSGEDDDDNTLTYARTRNTHPDNATIGSNNIPRQPTIQFEEPAHPKTEEAEENVKAAAGLLQALRFRKPRALNSRQKQVHEDGEADTRRQRTFERVKTIMTRDKYDDMPYLSYTPTTGRNSNFINLTLEQREELGGIEYRSLRTLMYVLLGYFWGFQLLGIIALLPYILHNATHRQIVQDDAIEPTWWGFWTANLAFMDVGFTLTPDSMISFQKSQYVLMWMTFLIIIGNTGFPVMLRFVIWALSKIIPNESGLWEELRFLLDHPRRCFTLLFPSGPNWWLFWILVALNVVDLLFFIILDLNAEVVEDLPVHIRVVNGLFQAASTRTAGFSSLPLTQLHPAMPVLYMIMMYISVFPIAISIRKTNVYEEKSLGMYWNKKDDGDEEGNDANPVSYVGMHLRRQLSFDLWYVFLGFFLLTITEGGKLKRNEFAMFDVLFEIVSAYGTVGLSLGVPNVNASLCSQFSIPGKLLIIAMEIRGRHRGLPYGLDRAVILPSESRFRKETEEPEPTLPRTNTGSSAIATGTQGREGSIYRGRGRSRSRSRERVLSKLLHVGPSVPSHMNSGNRNRTKSNASEALSQAVTNGSRRPQSYQTDADEEAGEAADGLAPLRTIESGPPKRTSGEPTTGPRRSFTG